VHSLVDDVRSENVQDVPAAPFEFLIAVVLSLGVTVVEPTIGLDYEVEVLEREVDPEVANTVLPDESKVEIV